VRDRLGALLRAVGLDLRGHADDDAVDTGECADFFLDASGERLAVTVRGITEDDVDRHGRAVDSDALDRLGGDQVLLKVGIDDRFERCFDLKLRYRHLKILRNPAF